MSSQSYSTSTSSYAYSSSTSTSTSNSNDPGANNISKSYTEKISSDSDKGTTYERTTTEMGKPTLIESGFVPAGGNGGAAAAATSAVDHETQGLTQRRVEDVTEEEEKEAEKRYLENMEEEYAKREGGA